MSSCAVHARTMREWGADLAEIFGVGECRRVLQQIWCARVPCKYTLRCWGCVVWCTLFIITMDLLNKGNFTNILKHVDYTHSELGIKGNFRCPQHLHSQHAYVYKVCKWCVTLLW